MSAPEAAEDLALAVEAVQLDDAGQLAGLVGRVDDPSPRAATWQGRRVVAGRHDACGECDVCRRGGAPVCPRGRPRALAGETTRASARWLVALDDGLELPGPAAAALPGAVALAYTLYARTGVAPRDPVVVTGDDAVARFLVEILLAKGITPVVVAPSAAAAWSAWLAGRGASVAAVASDDDDEHARGAVRAAIAAQAHEATAQTTGRPWRVIATRGLARAAALAGPRATLTVIAGEVDGAEALRAALAREVSVLGVAGPHPDLVLEAAALARRGEIDLAGGVHVRRADAPVGDRTLADVIVR